MCVCHGFPAYTGFPLLAGLVPQRRESLGDLLTTKLVVLLLVKPLEHTLQVFKLHRLHVFIGYEVHGILQRCTSVIVFQRYAPPKAGHLQHFLSGASHERARH